MMKKKFLTRAAAALLAVLLVFSCVLSRPAALSARAASLAGALALDEASMFLWNLLFTAFVGAGAYEAAKNDSYEMEAALYQGMVDYYVENYDVAAVSDDMVFTMRDGSRYTLGDLITAARWDVAGTEGCYIPDEATWQRFKLSAPADESAFSSVSSVFLSENVLEHLAGFAGAVAGGEVEGLEASRYFPYGFNGTLPQDADGKYIVQGHTLFYSSDGSAGSYVIEEGFVSATPVAACRDLNKNFARIHFLTLGTNGTVVPYRVRSVSYPGGVKWYSEYISLYDGSYSLNIPVFSSYALAEEFLLTGDFALSDTENAFALDYPALADAIPDTLAPLLAKELAPDILLDLYPALMDALNPALNPDIADTDNPALVLDPVAAADAYEKAVAGTVADVVDVAVPAVDADIGSYKVNLTNIFPFCLPFDFIRLLDALDAEPVTPVFEFPFVVPALGIDITVTLDMSFLEPAMEVFRMGETIGFVILLIVLTQRVIKW